MDNLLCLCDRGKGRLYINSNASVSSIFNNGQFYLKYYFFRHRNSPLEEIQLSVNCYVFIFNFHSPKYIYSILEERPKALLKMFLIDIDRLTLPRRPQDVIFEYIFKNTLLYRCFFNIDYR